MDQWTQEPSAGLTRDMRSSIKSHRSALDKAMSTDQTLNSLLSSSSRDVNILKRPLPEIESILAERLLAAASRKGNKKDIPSLIDDSSPENSDGLGQLGEQYLVEKIDNALQRMKELKAERTSTLETFRSRVRVTHFAASLALGQANHLSLFLTISYSSLLLFSLFFSNRSTTTTSLHYF